MAFTGRPKSNPNLGRQVGALRSKYPEGRTNFARGVVTWVGPIQPTPVSRTYTVKVEYQAGWPRPRITVLEPDLRDATMPPLPHVFDGDRLCLHLSGEWRPYEMIASTIIPWASEWLLHYEIWRATREWHGGGHDPGKKSET
jgi:hypothetical protein